MIVHILSFFVVSTLAQAAEPIGKFIDVTQKEDDPISVFSKDGRRGACVDCPIYEGDRIETKRKQNATVVMDEGTEISVGAESVVHVDNWNQRDSDGLLMRTLRLGRGALRAVVNKVYSDKEPFVVKSTDAVMGVRGTEFVAALNQERLRGRENQPTTSLYTVTGEVHFAKSTSDLAQGNAVVARAGYRSVIARGMDLPLTPTQYKPSVLNRLIKSKLPQVKRLQVQSKGKYDVLNARSRSVVAPKGEGSLSTMPGAEGAAGGGTAAQRLHLNPAVPGRPRPDLPHSGQDQKQKKRQETVRTLRPRVATDEAAALETAAKDFKDTRAQRGAAKNEYEPPRPGAPKAGADGVVPNKAPLSGSGFGRMMPGAPGAGSRPIGQTPGAKPATQPRPRPGDLTRYPRRPPPPPPPPTGANKSP
jgi:hypothetical protein